MAITAISMPRLRAPSSTRNGNSPLPAISPQFRADMFGDRWPIWMVAASYLVRPRSADSMNSMSVKTSSECGEGSTHFFESLRGVELGAQQQAEGLLDGFDALGRKTAALEADRVDAVASRFARSDDQGKRRHVLRDHGVRADIGVAADAAELVDGAERADVRVILDGDVAGQRRAIGEDRVVADDAIVGDVRVGHEEIVAADAGDAAAFHRAAVHGAEFAETFSSPTSSEARSPLIFQVLRVAADDGRKNRR